MFLVIYEDGSIETADDIKDDTFEAADNGYVDIINISNAIPTQYGDGEWHEIDKAQNV